PRGPGRRAGARRRGGGVRLPRGGQAPGAAVGAALRARVGVPHGDRAAAPRGPVPTEQPPVRVAAAAGVHEVTPRGHTSEGRPRHVRSRRDGKHFSTRTRRGRVAATTVGGGLTTP